MSQITMYKKFFILIVCGFLAMPAAAGDFVLGVYDVRNPKDLTAVKEAGFNTFQIYYKNPDTIASFARQANGLKMLAYPNKIIGSQYEQEAKEWPLYAWYLIDEPDLNNLPFEKLRAADLAARSTFPEQETAFVLSEGAPQINYYRAADIVMVDWYPVPHLALTSLGEQVFKAKSGLKKANLAGKPLIAVVQVFDWKHFKQHRPDDQRIGRYPSAAEIRFMSYHAVLNGATGLFYFSYPEAAQSPQEWQALKQTVKEFNVLGQSLANGEVIPAPKFIKAPLAAKSITYQKKKFLIVLNTSDKTAPTPAKLLSKNYKLLFSDSSFKEITAKDGGIAPFGVFVFSVK